MRDREMPTADELVRKLKRQGKSKTAISRKLLRTGHYDASDVADALTRVFKERVRDAETTACALLESQQSRELDEFEQSVADHFAYHLLFETSAAPVIELGYWDGVYEALARMGWDSFTTPPDLDGRMYTTFLGNAARNGFPVRFRERVEKTVNRHLLAVIGEAADYPDVVNAWAKESGMSASEVYDRYQKAASIAGKKFDPETKKWWKYKMGIFKKMMDKDSE